MSAIKKNQYSLYCEKSFVKNLHKIFMEYLLGNCRIKHTYEDNGVVKTEILKSKDTPYLDNMLDHKFDVLLESTPDNVSELNQIVIPSPPSLDNFNGLRDNIRKALYKIN